MIDFTRQITLIGKEAQEKISQAKAAIVGIGALGTVVSELLVRSGIKDFILIDRDIIEESNLQRQFMFTIEDINKSKAAIAKRALEKINPSINIRSEAIHLSPQNIDILKDRTIIIDCTDNLKTRFLINDFCKKNEIPWVYGAAIKTKGYAMLLRGKGPCLACFLAETSLETCSIAGVINTNTTAIASLQVNLALKYIIGETQLPELLYLDLWKGDFKRIKVNQQDECPACHGEYHYLVASEQPESLKFCSESRFQVLGKPQNLNLLNKKLKNSSFDGHILSFKSIILFKDGRAIIKAKSQEEAEGIYSKCLGK